MLLNQYIAAGSLRIFSSCSRWFPEHRALANGIAASGFGLTSLIFAPIELAIANPNNIPAVAVNGSDDKYYEDPDVLDRVPTMLYVLSIIYTVSLIIGCALFSKPPKKAADNDDDDCDDKEEPDRDEEKVKESNWKWSKIKKEVKLFAEIVLKSAYFYFILITWMGVIIVSIIVSIYYKSFALTFIESDAFITTYIATITGIFNCFGRIVYGWALDRYPYRAVVGVLTSILTAFVSTLYLTAFIGQYAYMTWIWILYFTFPAIYSGVLVICNTFLVWPRLAESA